MIRHWWGLEPRCNVAVATGAISGIFVIDVDGLGAEAELDKLEREYGELPPTVAAITPRPGRHIYFRMPDVPVSNSAGKIAPDIDVRGDGGYVLAPPSIHPSGRPYAWSVDSAGTIAAAPDWLLARITERSSGNGHIATAPSEWRALVADGVVEGQRDCASTQLAGHLLRRYVDPVVVLELVQAWNATHCTPPLPQADIERIVASICARELRRRGGNA